MIHKILQDILNSSPTHCHKTTYDEKGMEKSSGFVDCSKCTNQINTAKTTIKHNNPIREEGFNIDDSIHQAWYKKDQHNIYASDGYYYKKEQYYIILFIEILNNYKKEQYYFIYRDTK